MQNIDFGVAVGSQPVTRTVKLVNRSLRTVNFTVPDPEGRFAERCLTWNPTSSVTLRPKETARSQWRLMNRAELFGFRCVM